MTEYIMHLSSIKRQDENDQAFLLMLQRIRLGKQTIHDAKRILQLDIALLPPEERQKVELEAMYLFANKEPRDQHNLHCLSKECNNENPIAIIKSKIMKDIQRRRHHQNILKMIEPHRRQSYVEMRQFVFVVETLYRNGDCIMVQLGKSSTLFLTKTKIQTAATNHYT